MARLADQEIVKPRFVLCGFFLWRWRVPPLASYSTRYPFMNRGGVSLSVLSLALHSFDLSI